MSEIGLCWPGLSRRRPWPVTAPSSIAFKKQGAQEHLGGETLHGLARCHDVSRNLSRIWVTKYNEDVETALAGCEIVGEVRGHG